MRGSTVRQVFHVEHSSTPNEVSRETLQQQLQQKQQLLDQISQELQQLESQQQQYPMAQRQPTTPSGQQPFYVPPPPPVTVGPSPTPIGAQTGQQPMMQPGGRQRLQQFPTQGQPGYQPDISQQPVQICFACESRKDALLFMNGETAACSLMSEQDLEA